MKVQEIKKLNFPYQCGPFQPNGAKILKDIFCKLYVNNFNEQEMIVVRERDLDYINYIIH